LLSLFLLKKMLTNAYVYGVQYSQSQVKKLRKYDVAIEAGSGRLSLSKLRNSDVLIYNNPLRLPSREEEIAPLEFSADMGGIVLILSARGSEDFRIRLQNPCLKKMLNAEISHVCFDPFTLDVTSDRKPLEIESYDDDRRNLQKSYLSELKVPKKHLDIESAFVSYVPTGFPDDFKVDIGDRTRTEGEKFTILNEEYARSILTRRIDPAAHLVANSSHIEEILQKITQRRFTSPESVAKIITAFYNVTNRFQAVGVLNERIDSEYACSFGREITPQGRVAGFAGFSLNNDSDVYYFAEILKYMGGARSEMPKEEVKEVPVLRSGETRKSVERTSETTSEEPAGPLREIYPFKE
jgi:hypothetical protein